MGVGGSANQTVILRRRPPDLPAYGGFEHVTASPSPLFVPYQVKPLRSMSLYTTLYNRTYQTTNQLDDGDNT